MSHALIPAFCLVGRLDVVESVGEAIAAVVAGGVGVRRVAQRVDVPHTTAPGMAAPLPGFSAPTPGTKVVEARRRPFEGTLLRRWRLVRATFPTDIEEGDAMLSDFHQAKLRRHHAVCDWDGTGAVSAQDFESIAGRFAELRGEEAGSPVHQQLVDGFRFIWTTYWAPADTSHDGEVSPEEFIAAIAGAVDAGVRSDDVLLPLLYEMIDADGSGLLSAEEHTNFFAAFKISAEDAAATFAALDVDGDGTISKAEFLEGGAKFFFFDEPDAPGNLFWGPLEA